MSRAAIGGRAAPGSEQWCSDGTHDITRSRRMEIDRCVICGKSKQAIYDAPKGAQGGDFRVVCRQPGCDYGDRVDLEGHGYTNHVSLLLARAALADHQAGRDEPHRAKIQQHPCPEVAVDP